MLCQKTTKALEWLSDTDLLLGRAFATSTFGLLAYAPPLALGVRSAVATDTEMPHVQWPIAEQRMHRESQSRRAMLLGWQRLVRCSKPQPSTLRPAACCTHSSCLRPSIVFLVCQRSTTRRVTARSCPQVAPAVHSTVSSLESALDAVPFLLTVVAPALRTVSVMALSPQERDDLHNLVDVLVSYGLNYTMHSGVDERGVFVSDLALDPPLSSLTAFEGAEEGVSRRVVVSAMRQV